METTSESEKEFRVLISDLEDWLDQLIREINNHHVSGREIEKEVRFLRQEVEKYEYEIKKVLYYIRTGICPTGVRFRRCMSQMKNQIKSVRRGLERGTGDISKCKNLFHACPSSLAFLDAHLLLVRKIEVLTISSAEKDATKETALLPSTDISFNGDNYGPVGSGSGRVSQSNPHIQSGGMQGDSSQILSQGFRRLESELFEKNVDASAIETLRNFDSEYMMSSSKNRDGIVDKIWSWVSENFDKVGVALKAINEWISAISRG